MSVDRREDVKRLATSLRANYDTSNISGLRQIAADNRVIVIESPRVIVPRTSYAYPQPVIFTGKTSFFPAYDFFVMAHELGHALTIAHSRDVSWLNREREADLFAYELSSEEYRKRYMAEMVLDSITTCFFEAS